MIVSDALLRVVPFHTESFFCKKSYGVNKVWHLHLMPSHINQSRHFSNHQYISIAPIHFEENMYCTSFFLFLRRRKTTFLWRNAILKVPSWLQAHNLNEMELLICQLCVHVRHPLANEYVLVIKETRYITWAFCILCSLLVCAHDRVIFDCCVCEEWANMPRGHFKWSNNRSILKKENLPYNRGELKPLAQRTNHRWVFAIQAAIRISVCLIAQMQWWALTQYYKLLAGRQFTEKEERNIVHFFE